MHLRYQKNPKSECPDIWIRLAKHKWPRSWSSVEDPVVPLERNLHGHPLGGLLTERQLEKVLLNTRVGKSSELGMLICNRQKGLFLSVFVDDIKLAGKKLHRGHLEIISNVMRYTADTSDLARLQSVT